MDPDLLALGRLYSNRPKELARLLGTGSARDVLERNPLIAIGDDLKREVDQDLEWLRAEDHHLIVLGDDDYPAFLSEIHDPPCLLFAAGQRSILQRYPHRVAIVGARKASQYGLKQAHQIAQTLAQQTVLVVSGLALGIDSAAHEGALSAGEATLAVLGTGCDQIYPRRHWRLASRIQETGLVLSEFPLRTTARPGHFPRRNRIVTGMSEATVVIEAALSSGSLVSARLALAEGRDVMAVPGLVTNAQARGCHQLIRDGALLIESGNDVLKELGIEDAGISLEVGAPGLTAEQQQLMALLEAGPMSMDDLMADLSVSVEDMMVSLVTLEIMGLVYSEAGRYQLSQLKAGSD